MKTQEELNNDILQITMKIRDEYPELSKYLLEMHETIPDEIHPKIKMQTLQDYYNSLEDLLKKYTPNHLKND
ncbi:hypothetical protein [Flavobacterium sp.]|uniref:hypothetical protein n=1 Tax=Flavobacterium sp. TaxID=239 RepID=UPI00286DE454|nr:hypothetical protein [Flavobacterium sp.]